MPQLFRVQSKFMNRFTHAIFSFAFRRETLRTLHGRVTAFFLNPFQFRQLRNFYRSQADSPIYELFGLTKVIGATND